MIKPHDKWVRVCTLGNDGKIRWSPRFLEIIGYNRSAAQRFASQMLFGFDKARRIGVGHIQKWTFTENMPGVIDVDETEAIQAASFTHGIKTERGKRAYAPQLSVEFFRDMRRAVLCTAMVPVSLIEEWRDDLGLVMYTELANLRAPFQEKADAHRAKMRKKTLDKKMAKARASKPAAKRRRVYPMIVDYAEELAAIRTHNMRKVKAYRIRMKKIWEGIDGSETNVPVDSNWKVGDKRPT